MTGGKADDFAFTFRAGDTLKLDAPVKSISDQVMEFQENALRRGLDAGLDTAISELAWNEQTMSMMAEAIYLRPGAELPTGRKWTLYRTSAGLPDSATAASF